MDWYVENTTVSPSWLRYCLSCRAMFFGLVEAGTARSTVLSSASSALLRMRREALLSEQMHTALIGFEASACHEFRVCPSREIEGTRNRTRPAPGSIVSAIFRAVYVLPVPHAMMSFPRSLAVKCPYAAEMARNWCSRGCFPGSCAFVPSMPASSLSQSTDEVSRSKSPMRFTGGCWLCIASSAFAPQWFVVEIHRRFENETVRSVAGSKNVREEVARNESTSPLLMTAFSW